MKLNTLTFRTLKLRIHLKHLFPACSLFFFLFLLFPACPLSARPFSAEGRGANSLTLAEAIQIALQNNFQVQIARQQEARARLNNSWAVAGALPSLDLSVDQTNKHSRFSYSPGSGGDVYKDSFNTLTVAPTVSLNWTLFDGFGVQVTKKKLAYLQEFYQVNSSILEENTIQAIVSAYFNVLLETEKTQVLKEVMVLSKDRFDCMTLNKKIGNAGTYDVLKAEIAYLDDQAALARQQANLDSALRNLNVLMGQDSEIKYVLKDPFVPVLEHYSLSPLMSKLKQYNKTLKNRYINQYLLRKEVAFQKSKLYPVLRFSSGIIAVEGEVKFPGFPGATRNSFEYYANFSLTFNLFNGGKTRRAITEARIQERIGNIQTRQMEVTLQNILSDALAVYTVKKQLFIIAERSRKRAALSLSIATVKVKSGAIDSFQYRDIQIDYLNASFRRLQAIYDLIDTHTELLRLTGGIISKYK